MMRAPFAWSDRGEIRGLVEAAWFEAVTIRIGVVVVRFPSAAQFLRQEVISSPLAGPVGALDEDHNQALGSDLAQNLLPYADDEGLWYQLMLALYRADRRADALLAYRQLRQVLVEQLGVEPGATVRRLHRTILSGECAYDGQVLAPRGGLSLPAWLTVHAPRRRWHGPTARAGRHPAGSAGSRTPLSNRSRCPP